MKFEDLEQALAIRHDTLQTIALVEIPPSLYDHYERLGLIHHESLKGCPVFKSEDDTILYQRISKEVITLISPTTVWN